MGSTKARLQVVHLILWLAITLIWCVTSFLMGVMFEYANSLERELQRLEAKSEAIHARIDKY